MALWRRRHRCARCVTMEPSQAKSPGTRFRGFMHSLVLCLEAVVQASAHDVLVEADVGTADDAGRAVRLAEIGIEVLELGAPRAYDVGVDAAAERVARARLVIAAEHRRTLDVADRQTAGDVRHHAIERVADTAARRAEPIVLGFAGEAAAGAAALHAAPVAVAFEAEHARAGLPVV